MTPMPDPLVQTDYITHSSFYVHILLHREVCAKRSFYTQTPLHTERLSCKEAFTYRSFQAPMLYTQMLLYSGSIYAQAPSDFRHGHFLHIYACTRRRFYTEKSVHRTALTERSFPAAPPS